MKQLKGIYFYNGFNAPEKIADDICDFMKDLKNKDTTISSNYLGDLTSELESELSFNIENYGTDERDINNLLYDYSFFYNPSTEDFQNININRYGLDKNEYLKGLN